MRAYDLVLEAEVKQIHHLFILSTLVSEQVLHCVHIVRIPLQLKSRRVSLWSPEGYLVFLAEHTPIEKIVDALIVDLHETHVNCYFPLCFSPHSTDFL